MTKGRRSSTPDITDVTNSSKTGKRVRMCLFVLVLQQEKKKWLLKGSHYILVFTKILCRALVIAAWSLQFNSRKPADNISPSFHKAQAK